VTDVEDADIEATLEDWKDLPFRFVGAQAAPADLDALPETWRPIAQATDPAVRRATAVALWNKELLDHLPELSKILRDRLADVRVCLTDGIPALVYVVPGEHEAWVTWLGYDPRSFGEEPVFWDLIPAELRTFLREVHAGFVSRAYDRYGPIQPAEMQTLAAFAGDPDGLEDWDEMQEISSTRLLIVAREGELMYYCVSPDVGPGEIVQVYEGDVDPGPFWRRLDRLFQLRLDAE
jgi:hypothetical protein